MSIAVGESLPEGTFLEMGPDGPAEVTVSDLTGGRKVVIFGVPGAYTGVCSTRHVPSFMRVADELRAKDVADIVCVSVNDPFVLGAWAEATGGAGAGLRFLGDATSAFTKAIGLDFTAPARGLVDRSKRYAMLVEDGVVKVLNVEASPGECELSAGETLLAQV
ncbi:peroxiredoxin [Amaricoccus solimangrovi]|uniref:Glutathione-dependent peroxiredoxin n=1 Tax=Amaricoccus solimangrovi TaxID=2589815 RepID=A0A501WFE2_9RHOB|nr:peroxiredoxin [Amaricoccus solimangrovi]TPE48279.1 peroxiredoxin [Amaricoccus solimangrovi]